VKIHMNNITNKNDGGKDEKIEKMCCNCGHAEEILGTDFYNCKKYGAVLYNYCCKKFDFDPLKIRPVRAKSLSREQYDPGDFSV